MEEKLKELKTLMGDTTPEGETRKKELIDWITAHRTSEDAERLSAFVYEGLDTATAELSAMRDTLRSQIDADKYRLLPISYIAERYFGKSKSWLSQRLNGSRVRGKSYTLNAQQKAVFNAAVQDIAKQIGSVCIG